MPHVHMISKSIGIRSFYINKHVLEADIITIEKRCSFLLDVFKFAEI